MKTNTSGKNKGTGKIKHSHTKEILDSSWIIKQSLIITASIPRVLEITNPQNKEYRKISFVEDSGFLTYRKGNTNL